MTLLTMYSPDDNCPVASAFLKHLLSDMDTCLVLTAEAHTVPARSDTEIFWYWGFNLSMSLNIFCVPTASRPLTSGSCANALISCPDESARCFCSLAMLSPSFLESATASSIACCLNLWHE